MPTRASAINSVQKSCRILRSLTEPRVTRLSEIAAQYGVYYLPIISSARAFRALP